MKILLVEDDEVIAKTLENILRDRHYVVDIATEGDLGWEFVETYSYDLILLDIVLPKLNGIEFCKKLRSRGDRTPVLLLTAQQSKDKKVVGLDAGADDYVVKPFEISELLARIRVLLRRRSSLVSPILQWEKLTLNSSVREVFYDGIQLTLTPKEYRLLELFLNNSIREVSPNGNRVLTREIILDRLWDVEEAPSNNTVSAHIKELRRKLKQAGANPNLIETVYGVGYRLKPLVPNENHQEKSKKLLRQQTERALASVKQKFEQKNHDRLAILERASLIWQQGALAEEVLFKAQFAAHKLAGGLGLFGFQEGSDLARKMSELLEFETASEKERAKQFAELLTTLKQSLQPNSELTTTAIDYHRPTIVAIDNNPKLVSQIKKRLNEAKISFKLVTNPADLQQALTQLDISVVLWDFALKDLAATAITNNQISLPIILFTDNYNLSDRLKLAHLGQQLFWQPTSLDNAQIDRIIQTLIQSQKRVFQILVVDDDPLVAKAIATLLSPVQINLTSLKNPLDFWQITNKIQPDLLILDVAMPELTGIELCQLIRSEPRWNKLPILFLTIHQDLSTVQQILTVGGNDCISKTQTQSTLVSKIFHHLDRERILANLQVS